jgi:hypothetical protein
MEVSDLPIYAFWAQLASKFPKSGNNTARSKNIFSIQNGKKSAEFLLISISLKNVTCKKLFRRRFSTCFKDFGLEFIG